MLSAAALPTVAVMARPTTSESPPAGQAGARNRARTDRADDDGSVGSDGGHDGFVVVPEAAQASADAP
jgi:hypothetical protein